MFRSTHREYLRDIIDAAMARSHDPRSSLHGERHWRAVADAGLELARLRADINPRFVLLFAIFHDSCRENDDHDPEHGARASEAVRISRPLNRLLEPDRRIDLSIACRDHEKGGTSQNASIGACWDADRLNLVRVGITPDMRFMSTITDPGLLDQMIRRAEAAWMAPPSWQELADRADIEMESR